MFKFKDVQLVLSTVTIVVFGLLIHQSVSPSGINLQIIHTGSGIILAILASQIDFKSSSVFRLHFYLISCLLLLATLIIGVASRGSTRWLDIGLVRFQPSEFIKPLLILSFAATLSSTNLKNFRQIVTSTSIYQLPLVLIFLQPDLGTVIIMCLIFAGMLFASGIRLKYGLLLIGILMFLSPLLWFSLRDYQQNRVFTFLNPAADPLGKGYNSIQSVIAVGSGQLTGRGLGHGTQTKLRFLPEHRTDFIFASLSEELGLVGSGLLIVAYCWFILRLTKQAESAADTYTYLAIVGITTMFTSQTLINIGMNIGLLPVTGITLPLVSSGGTSTISGLISVGIVLSLTHNPRKTAAIEISASGS